MDLFTQALRNKEDGCNGQILECDKERKIALGYGLGIIGFVLRVTKVSMKGNDMV